MHNDEYKHDYIPELIFFFLINRLFNFPDHGSIIHSVLGLIGFTSFAMRQDAQCILKHSAEN